jgi:hypothetical protein
MRPQKESENPKIIRLALARSFPIKGSPYAYLCTRMPFDLHKFSQYLTTIMKQNEPKAIFIRFSSQESQLHEAIADIKHLPPPHLPA